MTHATKSESNFSDIHQLFALFKATDHLLIQMDSMLRIRRWHLLFICVFIVIQLTTVRSIGPAVTSSHHTLKALDFLDVGSEVTVLDFDFDQDIYYEHKCPQRPQDLPIEPTIILPCCNSTLTVGCVSPTTGFSRCIDTTISYDEKQIFPELIANRFAYEFVVANPTTCHSVMIGAPMKYGISTIKFFTHLPSFNSAVNEEFYIGRVGSNGLFLCCSLIRARRPDWNGRVYFRIELSVDSEWTTRLLDRIEVHCADGYSFTNCATALSSGCWPLAPALNDPPGYYMGMAAGELPEGEITGRKFVISLVFKTTSFASGTSSTIFFGANAKVLDPANQCEVTFPDLVNADGEAALAAPFPVEKIDPCDRTEFATIVQEFLARVDANSKLFNETAIELAAQQFIKALSFTWRKDWTACFSFIDRDLLATSTRSASFNASTFCPFNDPTDPRYLFDPCCNVRQQEFECCRPRDLIVDDYDQVSVDASAVANQCNNPRCVSETITDYLTLQTSTANRITGCTAQTSKALRDAQLSVQVGSCYGSLFETYCLSDRDCQKTTQLSNSVCTVQGYCTVPCSADEDCLSNSCSLSINIGGVDTKICKMINILDTQNVPFDEISTRFVQCIKRKIDPLLFFYIKREIGVSPFASDSEFASTLEQTIGTSQCVGFGSLIMPALGIPSNLTTLETCESSQSCNWVPCDSNVNQQCNSTYCTGPALGSDQFCGFCLYDQCFEVSSFPTCKYQQLTTETECSLYGGQYNTLNSAYPKCIRLNSECFPPNYCPSATSPCAALCSVPSRDSVTCTGTFGASSEPLQYQSWTRAGANYGVCSVPSMTTRSACLALSPGDTYWWPGTVFTPDNDLQALFNDEAVCTSFGTCNLDMNALNVASLNDLTAFVQSRDTCDPFCQGAPTFTEEQCTGVGWCTDWAGCYSPYLEDFAQAAPCAQGSVWTPKGCYIDPVFISRQSDCISPNKWYNVSTNKADCESWLMCTEPQFVNVLSFTPRDRAARLNNISFKNQTECTKCGGAFKSYYKWNSAGDWVNPGRFRPFEWRTRGMTTPNKWATLVDFSKAIGTTYTTIARRYADILSTELLCRYGQIQSAADQIVCDCAGDTGSCTSQFSSVRDATVGSVQFCTLVPQNQTFSRGYIYAERPFVEDFGCASVRVGIVPINQFNSRQTISLSSVALSAARDTQDGQERFYKNANNIVVGEVLGDGLTVDFLGRNITGVSLCLDFPDPTTSSLPGVTQYAVFSIPRDTRDLNISISETFDAAQMYHCFELTNMTTGKAYFTIALVDDWENVQFTSTLLAGEIALVAIGIVLYLIALMATVYHFAISIVTRDPKKPLLTQSRIALGLLIIFLLIRVLYLLLFVTGTFKEAQSADVIFSELPALIFLNIYCIIVLRWAALYHFGLKDGTKKSLRRLKPVLYVFDALLGAAFIILLIVFFTLTDQVTITCESEVDLDNFTTPRQIVAIVYKAFFAVVCIILSIAFLVYGSRIIQSSASFTVRSLDRAEQRAIKRRKNEVISKAVITVVCTLCLLGQAANLLRASATNEPGIYILIFVYPIELLPSIMFIIILKKVPFFYRGSIFGAKKVDLQSKKRNTTYGAMNARLMAEEDEEEAENAVPMSSTFNEQSNIPFTDVKVAQEIGTGNYGKVNLGTWNGSQVALKRSKAFERTEFVREARLVMDLPTHPNVVRTFGLSNDNFNLMLVMEYCNGGSLDVKLFDLPDPVTDKEKLALLIGVAQGMLHLHKNKIIHRDLAARNILLDNGVPKVSDFGLSRQVDDILRNSTTRNNIGPIRWMAPEALRDGVYSAKTDVWSYGVLIYEVIAQSEPHVEEDPLFIGIKIRDAGLAPKLPPTSDPTIKTLMEQCCKRDPSDRPDFNNICNVLTSRWKELYGAS